MYEPGPCSAHLQVSMSLNLRCPPEGGLYKSARNLGCHADSQSSLMTGAAKNKRARPCRALLSRSLNSMHTKKLPFI